MSKATPAELRNRLGWWHAQPDTTALLNLAEILMDLCDVLADQAARIERLEAQAHAAPEFDPATMHTHSPD